MGPMGRMGRMTRRGIVWLVMVAAVAGFAAGCGGEEKSESARGSGASRTVYVTRTGAKYHRAGCSSLSKSKIPISLEEAERKGYGPCARCKP